MKVYIYAYEGQYGGLHGMYDQDIVEVKDITEANEIGRDMSEQVIEAYDLWDDDFENELCWEAYSIANEYIDLPDEELIAIAVNEGHEYFVENYCDNEIEVV